MPNAARSRGDLIMLYILAVGLVVVFLAGAALITFATTRRD
jgi:cytoskeletal protein RodZ